jgi:hypothetical protein
MPAWRAARWRIWASSAGVALATRAWASSGIWLPKKPPLKLAIQGAPGAAWAAPFGQGHRHRAVALLGRHRRVLGIERDVDLRQRMGP